jgi:hypothetical protein
MLSLDDIKNYESKEHILKKYEKDDYINDYNRIIEENAELRYMINGKVISCPINYFDDEIIKRAKTIENITINKLIANLMVEPIIPKVIYSDWIYRYLIDELIKKNKIVAKIDRQIEINKRKEEICNKLAEEFNRKEN